MSCHQYEITEREPEYVAIHQYGNVVERGWERTGLKVDGQYIPGPRFVTKDAYYTINGVRYEGEYKPVTIGDEG